MKLKQFIRIVGINSIILATGAFVSGCVGIKQTYLGKSLPRDKVAILKTRDQLRKGFLLATVECDGVEIHYSYGGQFIHTSFAASLVPGKHKVTFTATAPLGNAGFHEIARCSTDVSVEAGGTYVATGEMIEPVQVSNAGITKPGVLSVTIVREK